MNDEELTAIKEKGYVVLNRITALIAIVIFIGTILSEIIYGFVWKNNTDVVIGNHEIRISDLEKKDVSDHELLMEIQINLKQYLETHGYKYTEVPKEKR